MQSRYMKCNALQGSMGMFLHSCNTPEKLIKVLARTGLSISLSSIHNALHSMSRKSQLQMQELGRTLLASYAHDNFDVKFNHGAPSLDKHTDDLIHLTSGTLLALDHGVKLEDLRCSSVIWDRDSHNPNATNLVPFDAKDTFEFLFSLHPEEPTASLLSRRGRFRVWKFIATLIDHGPIYFSNFHARLASPETIEEIPVTKLKQTPFRAMNINQSTVSGNIDAISEMLAQAGLGEQDVIPASDVVDFSEYMIPVHGDLGTIAKLSVRFYLLIRRYNYV